jgi:hypothetical protein
MHKITLEGQLKQVLSHFTGKEMEYSEPRPMPCQTHACILNMAFLSLPLPQAINSLLLNIQN